MKTIDVTIGELGQVKLEAYYPYVLAAYEKLGNVHTSLAVKEMLEHMKPLFGDVDYRLHKSGKMRCEKNAEMAILDVEWFGYIIKTEPAMYALTVAGRAALQDGVMYQSHNGGPLHRLEFTLV